MNTYMQVTEVVSCQGAELMRIKILRMFAECQGSLTVRGLMEILPAKLFYV